MLSDPGTPARVKRLSLRSWRRGTREMDMILGPFGDARLGAMDDAAMDAFEALMEEPDSDLYAWVTGRRQPPAPHAPLVGELRDFHQIA